MRNPTVCRRHKPGGSLPVEMAPQGVSQFLWHLLGGNVITTTDNVASVN
ncbi:MAG TPA: hypothetical protein VHP11_08160 [Tepidisphaeraceae bacterium]|nr:hypothetical protein [Tepidisphaeraceae bacterium]